MNDSWNSAMAYEKFMGRWSTLVARKFLNWLNIPFAQRWLDVGCGTGSLTKLILDFYQPEEIISIDPSSDFISYADSSIVNPVVHFKIGLAQSLELSSNSIDAVVSGLALNFVPDPRAAVLEMARVLKVGGKIGIFLWDYTIGMQMLRFFWDAAAKIDKKAKNMDEGIRFAICQEATLKSLLLDAGLKQVETKLFKVKTVFKNFNEYWQPFLGGVGPAPGYVMSLNKQERKKLEDNLKKNLPTDNKGVINISASAIAVKGTA
jgi:ubiquinone/menaquinone biosynthesis C-methylase UbiE